MYSEWRDKHLQRLLLMGQTKRAWWWTIVGGGGESGHCLQLPSYINVRKY